MKRCKQCGNEFNNKNSHYCSNCGHNLSDTIEKADTLSYEDTYYIYAIILGAVLFINLIVFIRRGNI